MSRLSLTIGTFFSIPKNLLPNHKIICHKVIFDHYLLPYLPKWNELNIFLTFTHTIIVAICL